MASKKPTRHKNKTYENNISTSFDEVKTKKNKETSKSAKPSVFIKEDSTIKTFKGPRREYSSHSNKPRFEKNDGERKTNNQKNNYANHDFASHREGDNYEKKPTRGIFRGSSSRSDMQIAHIRIVAKGQATHTPTKTIHQNVITKIVIALLIRMVKLLEIAQHALILYETLHPVQIMQVV